MTDQLIGYGYFDDQDEVVQPNSNGNNVFGVFGLNTGFITKFEYNSMAGSSGTAGDAIDITFVPEGSTQEFMHRFFPITRVFNADNQEITDKTSTEYITIANKNIIELNAVLMHIIQAFGIKKEQLKNILETNKPKNFVEFATIITSLKPVNFDTIKVDIFLIYQWKIKKGQNKTYLELPKNMKGGNFICPHIPGKWQPEYSWNITIKNETNQESKEIEVSGLRYINEKGNIHPFVRNQNFMESPKAKQKTIEQNNKEKSNEDKSTPPVNFFVPQTGDSKTTSW